MPNDLAGCWCIHLIEGWHWLPESCNPMDFYSIKVWGSGIESIFLYVGLLMGIKSYPCWVYGHGLFIQYTRTGKPMVFLNRVQSSAIVILFWEFIIKLITLLLRFLFW